VHLCAQVIYLSFIIVAVCVSQRDSFVLGGLQPRLPLPFVVGPLQLCLDCLVSFLSDSVRLNATVNTGHALASSGNRIGLGTSTKIIWETPRIEIQVVLLLNAASFFLQTSSKWQFRLQ